MPATRRDRAFPGVGYSPLSVKESDDASTVQLRRPGSKLAWNIAAGTVFVALVCAWVFWVGRTPNLEQPPAAVSGSAGRPLPECAPPTALAPEDRVLDNVWLSLSVDEALEVRNWLHHPAQRLNLTSGDRAIMR